MRPGISRLVGKICEAQFAPEAWPKALNSLTGALEWLALRALYPTKRQGMSTGFVSLA
jgi:hypothetical protein